MKKVLTILLSILICVYTITPQCLLRVDAEEETGQNENTLQVSAPSAILMEASTGTVIYEKDADTARRSGKRNKSDDNAAYF